MPVPSLRTLEARPDAVFEASAGGAWTSLGVSGMVVVGSAWMEIGAKANIATKAGASGRKNVFMMGKLAISLRLSTLMP